MPRPLEYPTLMTVADIAAAGVLNAAQRVKAWLKSGDLYEAGHYFPPNGKARPLYPGPLAMALATGTAKHAAS